MGYGAHCPWGVHTGNPREWQHKTPGGRWYGESRRRCDLVNWRVEEVENQMDQKLVCGNYIGVKVTTTGWHGCASNRFCVKKKKNRIEWCSQTAFGSRTTSLDGDQRCRGSGGSGAARGLGADEGDLREAAAPCVPIGGAASWAVFNHCFRQRVNKATPPPPVRRFVLDFGGKPLVCHHKLVLN